MFKKILSTIIILSAAVSIHAQSRIGINAGYNLSGNYGVSGAELITGGVPDWGMKSGFRFGLVSEFPLSKSFYLQPALLFTSQGFKDQYVVTTTSKHAERNFSFYYLQLPVNVQYKLDLGIPKLIFQAGPYIGYNLAGRQKYYISNVLKDLKDEYKKLKLVNSKKDNTMGNAWDYGVSVGAGVQVSRFQLTAGYNLGLSDLKFNKKKLSSREYPNVKMRQQQFFVGLSFYFGKYESLYPEE